MTDVWLGVVGDPIAEPVDAFVPRIGGAPAWVHGAPQPPTCSGCRKAMALLTQFHAPLKVFDRVIYVFVCATCQEPNRVAVLRSQVYNPDYDAQPKEAAAPQAALFAEEDDWGDDEAPAPAPAAPAAVPQPAQPQYATVDVLGPQRVTGGAFPCFQLELMIEPKARKVAEAAKEVVERALNPDDADESAPSDGDEPGPMDDFVERLARCPAQALRWHVGGVPLLAVEGNMATIPPCDACGAARQFEAQVVSPAIFFLRGETPEDKQPLHFSTVTIFTCEASCEAPQGQWLVAEAAFVQREV